MANNCINKVHAHMKPPEIKFTLVLNFFPKNDKKKAVERLANLT
jgi:hypothetical protein